MSMEDLPQGFILSESALYAFADQDVFTDLISFCSAIPAHLRPLFLIPIRLQSASNGMERIASAVAKTRVSTPTGDTEEGDLFGTKTFVYDDNEPTVPSSEPGSIFDIEDADDVTHHQDLETDQDQNVQAPTDTSYNSDVDLTDSYMRYPYRTPEYPVRHSTVLVVPFVRTALKPEMLETHAPEKVKTNAKTCKVKLLSYDKRGRVFTFSVNCGNGPHDVRAALTDVNHVAMNCDCNFWRWNGPEFHAVQQGFMLGDPRGTASPPNVRDPDRKYWLCKHAYAVLTRLDDFVADVVEKNWDPEEEEELSDEELLTEIDKNWDEMEEEAEVPLEESEEDDVDLVEEEEPGAEEAEEESEVEEPKAKKEPEGAEAEEPKEEEPEPEPEPKEEEPEPEPEPEPEEEEPVFEESEPEPEEEKKPGKR
jgi:hypothetical protein